MSKELELQAEEVLNKKLGKLKSKKFLKLIKTYQKNTEQFKTNIEPLLDELKLVIKIDMYFKQKENINGTSE